MDMSVWVGRGAGAEGSVRGRHVAGRPAALLWKNCILQNFLTRICYELGFHFSVSLYLILILEHSCYI